MPMRFLPTMSLTLPFRKLRSESCKTVTPRTPTSRAASFFAIDDTTSVPLDLAVRLLAKASDADASGQHREVWGGDAPKNSSCQSGARFLVNADSDLQRHQLKLPSGHETRCDIIMPLPLPTEVDSEALQGVKPVSAGDVFPMRQQGEITPPSSLGEGGRTPLFVLKIAGASRAGACSISN